MAKTKKPFYKKWWVWVLAIIVIGAIATGGDDETASTTVDQPSKKVEADSKQPSKPKEHKEKPKAAGIGDEVKVGDVVFTVHSTSTAKEIGNQYANQKAQGTYLIADVSVRNEGKKALTMTNSFFKLKSDGSEYEADATADMYVNDADSMFLIQQINPGNTAKGKIAFDVSDGVINSKDLVMNVQTGFWGTEQGTIKMAK